ncbi:nitroreductase family protein [Puniceicoccaceae bacterium K14]|nr:nitroreductase family protein [Puniceicoccaceae bacterium K14]
MTDSSEPRTIDQVIRDRKTLKTLSETPLPIDQDDLPIDELISAAAWAPFHKPAHSSHKSTDLSGVEPWRCYILDAAQCRHLREHLLQLGDKTKIPKMLAVSSFLIQFTWLPTPDASAISGQAFAPTLGNVENIAAASAAIQNMLLAATSREIPNYWSSGGALRTPEIFEYLGISKCEQLLGSIFLFPRNVDFEQSSPGALRDKRSNPSQWSRKVILSD